MSCRPSFVGTNQGDASFTNLVSHRAMIQNLTVCKLTKLTADTPECDCVTLASSLPTGSNTIGAVTLAGSLPTGSNTIGGVTLADSLPSGSNTIGTVTLADSLPTGSNTIGGVTLAGSLPTGSNTIGAVTLASGSAVTVSKFDAGDTSAIDAFARLRVSNAYTIFDSSLATTGNDPLVWDTVTTGSGVGTAQSNRASYELKIPSGTTGTVIRQSFQRCVYQPGKSQLILCTLVPESAVLNATKNIGYFDTNNGIFLQQTGTELSWVIRSYTSGAPVDTIINQSNWNVDPFDGSGPSGLTLDPQHVQLLLIDFAWLGVGRVRCGFFVNGLIYYAHDFDNSALSEVFMSTPQLPIRYEIRATAAVPTDAILRQICSSVQSEGGFQRLGRSLVADAGLTVVSCGTGTGPKPLLAIRLSANYKYCSLIINHIHALNTDNVSNVNVRMYYGATITTTGAWTAITNSAVEYTRNSNITGVTTYGTAVDSFYLSRDVHETTSEQPNAVFALSGGINDTTGKTVLIVGEGVSGTPTMLVSVQWTEICN